MERQTSLGLAAAPLASHPGWFRPGLDGGGCASCDDGGCCGDGCCCLWWVLWICGTSGLQKRREYAVVSMDLVTRRVSKRGMLYINISSCSRVGLFGYEFMLDESLSSYLVILNLKVWCWNWYNRCRLDLEIRGNSLQEVKYTEKSTRFSQ